MGLSGNIYSGFLRLPHFKGKGRIENLMRQTFFSNRVWRVAYDLKMELNPLEWTEITLIRDGLIEPKTVSLFDTLLEEGDTYVDVGAHVGFHTLVARRKVGEAGTIVAFEPQPYNCQKVLSNWRVNGFSNITLYVAAVGDRDDAVMLHEQSPTDKSRLSLALAPVNDCPQRFRVPLLRLDSVFAQMSLPRVKLLKIDVEGYERAVLSGLGDYGRSVENIILEVLGTESALGRETRALLADLARLGYRLMTVEGKPWSPGQTLPESNVWAARN